MKVKPFDDIAFLRDHPKGTVSFDYLLMDGQPESLENYRYILGRQEADFHMPRHRHTFEQVRLPLVGDMHLGEQGILHEGDIGYFPGGLAAIQAGPGEWLYVSAAEKTVLYIVGLPPVQLPTTPSDQFDVIENVGPIHSSRTWSRSVDRLGSASSEGNHRSVVIEPASDIVDAALRKARALELRPLTITVLDPGGHALAVKREDGAGILRRRSRMRRHGDASGPARAAPPAHGMRPVTRHFSPPWPPSPKAVSHRPEEAC
jgi:hypothetical protein